MLSRTRLLNYMIKKAPNYLKLETYVAKCFNYPCIFL